MGFINDEHEFIHTKYAQSAKPAIGFKLTDDGNYDMENKKIFKLKTQNDVAVDADYDSYVLDMKSGVNKEYLKLNCLTKDDAGNNFDANQSVIHNTEPYYDGLYQKTSLVSKEYVDLKDNLKADKADLDNKADLISQDEQSVNALISVPDYDQNTTKSSHIVNKKYLDSTYLNKLQVMYCKIRYHLTCSCLIAKDKFTILVIHYHRIVSPIKYMLIRIYILNRISIKPCYLMALR